MNIFNRLKRSRFIKNTSWMMLGSIYQMVVSLFIGLITARYLGPSNYGIINYVAAFISFATPICGLGFEGVVVKKLVDNPKAAGEILGTTIFFEFITSIFCSTAIVFVVSISNAGDFVKTAVAFLESFQLLFKSAEPINFWFQSRLESKYTSIASMIAYTVMTVYRIILLILGKSVEWFAFATSLDLGVVSLIYFFIYKKRSPYKLKISLVIGKDIFLLSYHFIISGLMSVIYSQMDKVMIQAMVNDTGVGLYSAAYTVSNLWFLLPNSLIMSARPMIMEDKNKNEDLYLRRLKQLYAGVFWLGIVVGLVFTLFAKQIMYILYGTEYLDAAETLTISIWYGIFAQLGNARGIWILCENNNKYVKYYLGWGVVVNLILNWILIHLYGINGAAIATLVTQIFTCLIAPLFYKRTRVHTKILIDAVRFKWN